MQTEHVHFYSDGLKLAGSFFLPDDLDTSRSHPVVIICSGFTGLRSIHPARFARYLTQRGHVCFGFDYRGFADSEGPRRRVVLDEQVRDIIYGASFAESDERIQIDRTILLGWGMGAGLVLDASRELLGVVGLIAVNGFYEGKRVQMAHRGPREFLVFRDEARRQWTHRARGGEGDWDEAFHFYPLDPDSKEYVDNVLARQPGYDQDRYSGELRDSLLRWFPEAYAPHMRTPLLIAHGTRNALHPYTEAESLFAAYGGPKSLYWIQGGGHTEWMHDENPRFQALGDRIDSWIRRLLESQ